MREGGFPELRELSDEEARLWPRGAPPRRRRHEAELLLARRADPDRPRTVHNALARLHIHTRGHGQRSRGVRQRLRRPTPRNRDQRPVRGPRSTRAGENFYGDAAIFDLDELPGADDHVDEDLDLPRLTETFRASPWATLQPFAIGCRWRRRRVRSRCGTDRRRVPHPGRVELVDWKTGRVPHGWDLRQKSRAGP
ncbi:hypothetical protein QJS66_22440 [Kocuria rhizophila]|nr:hypothetical protein QJS66_22440 [Kocuria rhizophila]